MNFDQFFKQLGHALKNHAPAILSGLGVVGVVGTAALTANSTIKAVRILDEVYPEGFEWRKDWKGVLHYTWKTYLPPAIACGMTVASIIGSGKMSSNRAAALAGAYSLSQATLKEYKKKVVEKLGETKEQEIRDEIAKDRVDRQPLSNQVFISGDGDVPVLDSLSGRYFMSSMEKLKSAENNINHTLINGVWVSVNELYDELGLQHTKMGDDLGWNTDNLVQFKYSTTLADNGKPCIVLDFEYDPRFDVYRCN